MDIRGGRGLLILPLPGIKSRFIEFLAYNNCIIFNWLLLPQKETIRGQSTTNSTVKTQSNVKLVHREKKAET